MRRILRLFWDAVRGKEYDFTQGSINRSLFLLAVPMILEMIMESVFALVDAFYVGRLGPDALATVGLTESVITLVYAIGIGISTAPVAMVSRFIGQKDEAGAARAAKQAIYIAVAVSLGIGIPGYWLAEDILRYMGGSEALIASGSQYARIMFGSNVVIMLLFLLNGIFRGAGEAAYAMRALWIANGLNIILDPIFIFGWGPVPAMGVGGAAIATTIGRGVGVAYQLWILLSGRSVVRLATGGWLPNWDIIRRLVRIASTGAIQYLIASASWIFLMRINAQFGSAAVAGYTVAIRLILFTLLPAWGLANAAATLVGQNLGAEQPERAEQSVWRAAHVTGVLLALVSIAYYVFAPLFIRLFTDDIAVIEPGVTALRIFAIGYAIFGYGTILSQAFNGAGDTRTPTYINLICFWLMEIPLGYFLAVNLELGIAGVCWSVVISETVMAGLCIWLFLRGRWKLTVV